MKKMISILACLIIAIPGIVFAAGEKAGTTTGEFLRLPAGAKPAAMGEAYSALADDVYSVYFNLGGLAKVQQQQAILAHTMYYVDVNHEYLAYVRPFRGGGLGISLTYLMTTFEVRTADTDSAESNGSIGDMAVSVGYGKQLPLWGIDGGIALKYISSKLDTYNATSVAVDFGLQKKLNENVCAGLSVTNLGAALKYIADSVAVGNTVDFGIAEKGYLVKNLTGAIDFKTQLDMSGQTINLGLEYLYSINKDWQLAPRAGFISHNAAITAGFGLNYKAYQLDYALNTQADLGLANRISLGVKF
jgi:hypothetical protein